MNQGGALVHVYTDGQVLVTHGSLAALWRLSGGSLAAL
jgi:hypothetical protein